MQFDWQETSTALMDDRYRDMVRTKWQSLAMRDPRTRLPFAARLRVFVTGRIDPADIPLEPMRTA